MSFVESDRIRIGVLSQDGREVVDLAVAAPELPPDMLGLIALSDAGVAALRGALDGGRGRLGRERVRLLAPIPRPARGGLAACLWLHHHQ